MIISALQWLMVKKKTLKNKNKEIVMPTEEKTFTAKRVIKLLGHFKMHIHQINHDSITWSGGVQDDYIFIGTSPLPIQGDCIMMNEKIKVKNFKQIFDAFAVYTPEYHPLFIYHKPKSEDD